MRIRHSLKNLVPVVVLLLAGIPANAQYGSPYPSSGMTYYNGSPGYGPGPGGPMMPGQGPPPSFLPYPNVSPYDHMLDEHYNQNGLWFRNAVNGFGPFNHPRNYFFNVDYTRTKTRDLNGIVGDENVPTYLQQQLTPPTTTGGGAGGAGGGTTGGTTQLGFYNFFNAASGNMIPDLKTDGMRINGGFWNTDGTGFLVNTSWNASGTSTFDARRNIESTRLRTDLLLALRRDGGRYSGAPYYLGGDTDRDTVENDILAPGTTFDTAGTLVHGPLGTTNAILDRSLFNLFGIPMATGVSPFVTPQTNSGITVPYDMDFILQHSIKNFGASTDWAFNPIYERQNIKVRPLLGGRYYRIDEGFAFRGVDSGLSYGGTAGGAAGGAGGAGSFVDNTKAHPANDGIDDDGDFITDNPAEGGATTFTQVGPLVRAALNSDAVSDLAGPELGMHYELGDDDGIRITGSTKLAAMFNRERVSVGGVNIGNHMGQVDAAGTTTVTDIDTTLGNSFSDRVSNTHISPLFEQGINAQIPIFSRVPVLRDMWQLEGASLNVGWSALVIGEVADPNQSIVWASRPTTGLFPHAKVDRELFYQTTFNFGINWTY